MGHNAQLPLSSRLSLPLQTASAARYVCSASATKLFKTDTATAC